MPIRSHPFRALKYTVHVQVKPLNSYYPRPKFSIYLIHDNGTPAVTS